MTEEKMKYGTAEAFSFQKGVVKIDGQWLRFGPEVEAYVRELSFGDKVGYIAEGRKLLWIEKAQKPQTAQQQQPTPAPAPKPAPVPAQATAAAQAAAKGTASAPSGLTAAQVLDNRNKSIERQVALKAAVELAGFYGYGTTKECLDVAATFAAWIEGESGEDVRFPARS